MILDEGTLIDISLNSASYDSNSSTTDLYNNEKKKKKKMFNKWCICFTATIICGLTLTGLFLLEAFKENSK
jgi:hypothetical protein